MTQGGPLPAKLFNIIVNTVVHEWMQLMCKTLDYVEGNLAEHIRGLFVVFYVNNRYIASCDAEFLQEALDILVKTFKCAGLATNTKKTQAMICTSGKIWFQLPVDLYRHMCKGVATGKSRNVQSCVTCAIRPCKQGAYARTSLAPMISTNRW